MNILTRIETITPEKAKKYLEHNCINRKPNKSRVSQYATDMRNGKWQLNGETIIFDEDGMLKNGQHRLMAVVEADIPVQFLVVRGVPRDSSLQDRGRMRSVSDAMIIDGISSSLANNKNVAIAKLHFHITTGRRNLSDFEIRNFILDNSDLILKVRELTRAAGASKTKGVNANCAVVSLACMYALSSGESEKDIAKFLRVMQTGIPDTLCQNAALICRNDMLNEYISLAGISNRLLAINQIEKAIFDFCRRYSRRKSYVGWNKMVYPYSINYKKTEAIA